MASWFGFDDATTVEELTSLGFENVWIFDDEKQCWERPGLLEKIYPVFEGIPMGWSWGLYFANESTAFVAGSTAPGEEDWLLRERAPVPVLAPDKTVTGVYVDNVQVVGGRPQDVDSKMNGLKRRCREIELPLETSHPCSSARLTSLGL